MPHGFRLQVDDGNRTRWVKRHNNGEKTVVDVEKDVPGEDYRVKVRDPRGNMDLGKYGTLGNAKKRAKEWMASNPKGAPAQNKGIAGANAGIPGMDGNGLF